MTPFRIETYGEHLPDLLQYPDFHGNRRVTGELYSSCSRAFEGVMELYHCDLSHNNVVDVLLCAAEKLGLELPPSLQNFYWSFSTIAFLRLDTIRLRRLYDSPCAGQRLFRKAIEESMGQLHPNAMIRPVDFTVAVEKYPSRLEHLEFLAFDETMCEFLQGRALECRSDVMLRWLDAHGWYDARRNSAESLLSLGNAAAFHRLLQEGVRPSSDITLEYVIQYARSREVVKIALDQGGSIEALASLLFDEDTLPEVLRWLMELSRSETERFFTADLIISLMSRTRDEEDKLFGFAEILREFGYRVDLPELEFLRPIEGEEESETKKRKVGFHRLPVYGALYTFGFVSRLQVAEIMRRKERNDEAFRFSTFDVLWRSHTHHLFPASFKQYVIAALLALKRKCPLLPRDLRLLILQIAFGEMLLRSGIIVQPLDVVIRNVTF